MINFETKISEINSWKLILLPKNVSAKLPSRGMVLVKGTINGFEFKTALEPDGRGSHWLKLNQDMLKGAKAKVGDTVKLAIEPSKDWPEPDIPSDIQKALKAAPKFNELWMDTTPMARWDWIRWIQATNNPQTRANHIEVAFSKLKAGTRRPCCFNRTICTVQEVSKSGALLPLA